jgi:hypothetical protein
MEEISVHEQTQFFAPQPEHFEPLATERPQFRHGTLYFKVLTGWAEVMVVVVVLQLTLKTEVIWFC